MFLVIDKGATIGAYCLNTSIATLTSKSLIQLFLSDTLRLPELFSVHPLNTWSDIAKSFHCCIFYNEHSLIHVACKGTMFDEVVRTVIGWQPLLMELQAISLLKMASTEKDGYYTEQGRGQL